MTVGWSKPMEPGVWRLWWQWTVWEVTEQGRVTGARKQDRGRLAMSIVQVAVTCRGTKTGLWTQRKYHLAE